MIVGLFLAVAIGNVPRVRTSLEDPSDSTLEWVVVLHGANNEAVTGTGHAFEETVPLPPFFPQGRGGVVDG